MRVNRRRFSEEEPDPSSLVSNMFDIAMVFAVALMVALVTKFNMTEVFSKATPLSRTQGKTTWRS